MTKITSVIAATLIATASFAGAAFAEGNYYEGATPPSAGVQVPATHQARHSADYGYTGSISRAANAGQNNDGMTVVNRGDYYDGANRPN